MLQALKNRIFGMSGMKKIALLLCLILLLTVGIGFTVSYVVTETPTLVNLFLNGMDPDGDLVIQKTVSHPYGDAYSVPSELTFTFEVDLGEKYAGKTVKTGRGEITADENGVIAVTVAPGGRTTVYDIDEGTAVTVTETQIGKGFTPDAVSQEITIQKHQDNILNFINTYTPEKANTSALTVSGVKTLVGRDWIEGDSFTFDLSVYQDGAWSSLGTRTITYETVEQPDPEDPEKTILVPKPDFDQFDFSELIRTYAFDEAGTYSFRISEVQGTIGGLTYDKAESKFDILVGDEDMDGYLEILSVTTSTANTTVENTAVSISFENKYAPVGSTEAFIEIRKVMEDTSGQNRSPAGFTFELYDAENNLIAVSDPTTSTGETSIRLVYEPTDAGKTVTYVLKEVNGGQTVGALTYDDTEYKIQASIVDDLDGTVSAYIYDWQEPENNMQLADSDPLSPAAAIPEGATDTYQATFTNEYDPQDATTEIGGTKTLSGRDMQDGEFTFLLYPTDDLFAVAEGARPIDTAANTAGAFTFDPLTFDKVGTYYYVVVEDASAALGGVDYDSARYLVTIVVTDENGVLTAKTSITDDFGEEKDIQFVNSYQAASVSLPLDGKKSLSGAELKDHTFRFRLDVADENFIVGGSAFQTVESDGNGDFSFAPLIFTKAGTYRYVVTEDSSAAVDGMTYDDTVYQITVVVSDPGDGQLAISEVTMSADGEAVTSILFKNTYVEPAKPADPSKPADKTDPDSTVPENPTKPTAPKEPTSTETGDTSNLWLWIALLFVSGGAIVALAVYDRKRKTK